MLNVGLVAEMQGALLKDGEIERELVLERPHHPELVDDAMPVPVLVNRGLRVNSA